MPDRLRDMSSSTCRNRVRSRREATEPRAEPRCLSTADHTTFTPRPSGAAIGTRSITSRAEQDKNDDEDDEDSEEKDEYDCNHTNDNDERRQLYT